MEKKLRGDYSSHTYKKQIFNLVPEKSLVLEVGCNFGQLGKDLRRRRKCIVYGIDFCASAIERAKDNLDLAKVVDLENYETPFNKKFDIIVFEDVLEHIRYPEKILHLYKGILKSSGKIIVSLPNIANINVRFRLLFGNWDYKNHGILDKSHFRFYTKKTMKSLLKKSGYSVDIRGFTPGFNFVFFRYFNFFKKIRFFLCSIYPPLFAKQFILEGKLK